MAIAALNSKLVQRIILTRPAVEAGERLGFLPGDLQEKINPYLRPLYDALYDMMEMEKVERLLEKKVIEVAPLAFMRGRTLNDAFIIMDEAQNTSPEQMKMFLTRLGFGSRAVVTGDITQIDLPPGQRSGLIEVRRILTGVNGLSFIVFDDSDVVRHPLVQRIVQAYDAHETSAKGRQAMKRASRLPQWPPQLPGMPAWFRWRMIPKLALALLTTGVLDACWCFFHLDYFQVGTSLEQFRPGLPAPRDVLATDTILWTDLRETERLRDEAAQQRARCGILRINRRKSPRWKTWIISSPPSERPASNPAIRRNRAQLKLPPRHLHRGRHTHPGCTRTTCRPTRRASCAR